MKRRRIAVNPAPFMYVTIVILIVIHTISRTGNIPEARAAQKPSEAYNFTSQCHADQKRLWKIHLRSKNNSVYFSVPETLLPAQSRKESPVRSASMFVDFNTLKAPCTTNHGKRQYSHVSNMWLTLKAKPKNSNNAINAHIRRVTSEWKKIEDKSYPEFSHYILPGDHTNSSYLIPRKHLNDDEKYIVSCRELNEETGTCTVRFNYRGLINVNAVVNVEKIHETEEVMRRATTLLDEYRTSGKRK